MNGVEFEEQPLTQFNMARNNAVKSKMANFLIKKGLVSSEGAANVILVIVAVVFIAAALLTYFVIGPQDPEVPKETPPEIIKMIENAKIKQE